MKVIPIGSDHAGYELKQVIIDHLIAKGYQVADKGTYSEESTDYPDYAHQVADAINEEAPLGILICGSGNGIAMTANKHQNIRCAIAWNTEIAELARLHNDANIVSLPARFISKEEGIAIVDTFLSTEFEGGRHARRVGKIACS